MRLVIVTAIFFTFLAPHMALAKRGPRPIVEPVDCEGVRYTAQNDYIFAVDIRTGKPLWNRLVFKTITNPLMEEDVQWIEIKKMSISREDLIVVAEDGKTYAVNLKTKNVTRIQRKWFSFGLIVMILISIAIVAVAGKRFILRETKAS